MIGAPGSACIKVVWHRVGTNNVRLRGLSTRLALHVRRNHITQKVRIAGQRTLYLSGVKGK
jgi:hypothetical protein